jgi:outer membrane receptor protein involved in Fe transport
VSSNNVLSINEQIVDIDQRNFTLAASYAFDALGGRNELDVDFARFEDSSFDTEEETSFDDDDSPPSFDEIEGERTLTDTDDRERGLSFTHVRALADNELEIGADYQRKTRETDLRISEVDTDEEGAPLPPYSEFERNRSRIEERRVDPYLMLSGTAGTLRWETGLRYEMTDTDVSYDAREADSDGSELLPSLHLRWSLNDNDRINLSLARTVRRPNFNFILPLALEEEFGDNDFIGNPLLEQETANGIDLGFERRLGARGVVGFNVFYRDVSDLIEIFNTGEPSATALDDFEDEVSEFLEENPGALPGSPGYPEFDPDIFVYSAGNVGDGKVYGFEFDLSTPLDVLGLPDTGFFANYSWLDSEVDDFAGERTFNDQAEYVYNFGFIHDLPQQGMSFGLSYRKQGNAFSRVLAEEVETRYGADLEAFVEKRFGETLSLRLTGSNLLNASKDEFFDKFDTEGDQLDRDYDEFETETEEAGPMIQLIGRYAFK